MHGLRQVVRLNWPFYAAATLVIVTSTLGLGRLAMPSAVRVAGYTATGLAAFWLAGSLAASWIVYDGSRLMKWTWILRALGSSPRTWINIHAGLDESTPALRALFAGSEGRVFDMFNPATMTEPSIARARQRARNAIEPETVDIRHLPVPTSTVDAALLLLSAHELRTDDARRALFEELRRVLTGAGRIVVVEHLRNWANLMAFGPGFLHFHSRRTWTRCFTRARLTIQRELSITPFVHVFVLEKSL